MGKYKICNDCHLAFDNKREKCPSCGRIIKDNNYEQNLKKEGSGREYRTGGEACDYCLHCYGDENYCPIVGD